MTNLRMGEGYDVHRLVENRELILGGVHINHDKGLLGHSDADVLAHAIMDALLGAAALGDIGLMFPDDSDEFLNANSLILLKQVCIILKDHGFSIVNIDSTIVAQKPKLRPYIDAMRQNIADVTGLDISQISVKATTEEKLGFTGQEEGIAAKAIALIERIHKSIF